MHRYARPCPLHAVGIVPPPGDLLFSALQKYHCMRHLESQLVIPVTLWSGWIGGGGGQGEWIFMKRGRSLPKFWIIPKTRVCSYWRKQTSHYQLSLTKQYSSTWSHASATPAALEAKARDWSQVQGQPGKQTDHIGGGGGTHTRSSWLWVENDRLVIELAIL